MAQKSIELILFRQLANYLVTPVFIVDPDGNLIFFNEAAEKILGFKFSEAGEMPAEEWSVVFEPKHRDGSLIPPEKLPLFITYTQHRPAHDNFYIVNLQGKMWHIEVFTLPIINQIGDFLGAVAFFQEMTS